MLHRSHASILVLLLGLSVSAQPAGRTVDLGALEERVKRAATRAIRATVSVWNGGGGSGVIVSPDGWVLTAAHVLKKPGGKVQVVLHNGKPLTAKSMGRIGRSDAALVKITAKGRWPWAPMGTSDDVKRGALCLSTGTPMGYLRGRTSPLRLGTVLDQNEHYLRTSCTLDRGDSGGPLFDINGVVIGVNSRIGSSLTKNYHVPVGVFRDKWERLVAGEKIDDVKPPPNGRVTEPPRLRNPVTPWRSTQPVRAAITDVVRRGRQSVVAIESSDGRKVLGTVVAEDGWIVTKASELGRRATCRVGKKRFTLETVHVSRAHDLVVVKVDQTLVPVELSSRPKYEPGMFLLTALATGKTKIGVVGSGPMRIRNLGGYLGASFENADGAGARVKEVKPRGAAFKAKLVKGDVLLALDDQPIKTGADLRSRLRRIDPGTSVVFRYRRGKQERTVTLRMGSRRDTLPKHLAPAPGDPFSRLRLSTKRSGFRKALQHDTALLPSECGGPVFDLNGACVAINLARASRHASLAVPAAEVKRVVADARRAVKKRGGK
ncbi:MAG: hypothetical protein CMJ83_18380 [Planctomycetes bacterium]|nr:hypothetical protein [Planctomycetota bacterium]